MDCASQDKFSATTDGGLVVGGDFGEGGFFFDGDVAVFRRIEDFSALLTLNKFCVFLAGDDFDNGMFAGGGHLGSKNVNGMDFARPQTPCQPGFLDFRYRDGVIKSEAGELVITCCTRGILDVHYLGLELSDLRQFQGAGAQSQHVASDQKSRLWSDGSEVPGRANGR